MSGRDLDLAATLPAEVVAALAPRTGVAIARVAALSPASAWVRLDAYAKPVSARSTIALTDQDIDTEVVVAFDGGNPQAPIILGRVLASPVAAGSALCVQVDGERLVLSAKERIVLTCGEASMTLTRSGKVLIRGHYVQSRATGVNSVKGGSVELN